MSQEQIPGDDVPEPPDGWFEDNRTDFPDSELEGTREDRPDGC